MAVKPWSSQVRVGRFGPNIPGLRLWVDMQDPQSYSQTGGVMNYVENKISTRRITALDAPAFSATAINARPGIVFDGVFNYMRGTEARVLSVLAGSLPFTLFMVMNQTSSNARTIMSMGSESAGGAYRTFGSTTSGTRRWSMVGQSDAAATFSALSTATVQTGTHILEWYGTGPTVSLRVDGGASDPNGAAVTIGTSTLARITLGALDFGIAVPSQFFDGSLGETLLYNRLLSEDTRGLIRKSLSEKWAIRLS